MKISRIIYLTPDEYRAKLDRCEKLCEDCGHIQSQPASGVRPLWPENYPCAVCGEKTLIGFDLALALKLVELADQEGGGQ